MNIKEFAQDFIDSVKTSAEIVEKDYDLELASAILEYITDSGEVNAPELCYFQKTRSRITAYDFNDEAESLDLFYLIKADTLIGKINNGKIEGGFNYLQSFYREAINDSLLRGKNISITEERPLYGILARDCSLASAYQYIRCSVPHPSQHGDCYSQVLP